MDLDGRVALVTGASRGIGAAKAGRLAEAGVGVAFGYANDKAAPEEQTARISGMGDGPWWPGATSATRQR